MDQSQEDDKILSAVPQLFREMRANLLAINASALWKAAVTCLNFLYQT